MIQPKAPNPKPLSCLLTDENLFKCPFIFLENAGTIRLNDAEVKRLQDYFMKGGFSADLCWPRRLWV